MVKYSQQEAHMLGALADPTRYDIMLRLVKARRLCAGDIARAYSMSLPAVSKHLNVLKRAKLATVEESGRNRFYTPNTDSLAKMKRWFEESELFWKERLDALADYVESD